MATRTEKTEDPTTSTGWRPEPGDQLVGTMVDGAVSQGGGWGSYPVMTLRLSDGTTRDVHCFHDVLKRRMLVLRPQIGERVRVTFHGTKRSADGKRTISLYTVEVAGRGVDPWAAYEREEAAVRTIAAPQPQAAPIAAPPQSQQEFPDTPPAPDDIPF